MLILATALFFVSLVSLVDVRVLGNGSKLESKAPMKKFIAVVLLAVTCYACGSARHSGGIEVPTPSVTYKFHKVPGQLGE